MKKILLLLVFLGLMSTVLAQQNVPRSAKFDFVPGKIIVKLKDEIKAKVTYNKKGQGSTTIDIANLIGFSGKVKTQKVLFSEKKALPGPYALKPIGIPCSFHVG